MEKSKQSKPSESLKASKSEQEIRIPSIETEESPRQAVKQEDQSAKSEEKSEPGVQIDEDELELAKKQIEKVMGSSARQVHKKISNMNIATTRDKFGKILTAKNIILDQVEMLQKMA